MYSISELREKDREELLKLISELKGKLLALRFESATGQLTETHLPSSTKKDIAKIFTVLKEKELGIVVESKSTKTARPNTTDSKAELIIEEEAKPVETPSTEEVKTEEAKPAEIKEEAK